MPATVKSLEERIDDLSEDVVAVKVQMGAFGAGQNLIQAQLSTITNGLSVNQAVSAAQTAKLEAAVNELVRTNDRMDASGNRFEAHAKEFTDFRARTENSFSVAKWAVTFAAGVFITVLSTAFWIIRETDRLNSKADQQQRILEALVKDVGELKAKAK